MSAECKTCPFAFSDESENVQNLGCLPTPQEILRIKRDTGKNWACHDNESRPCAGYVRAARKLGIDYRSGGVMTYSEWWTQADEPTSAPEGAVR